MRFFCSILLFVSTSVNAFGQSYDLNERPDKIFRLAFWNLENLFDTENDPNTQDDDFTPEGNYRWSPSRYYKKLMNLSKTIVGLGGWSAPDILGMCEVENKLVVRELIERTPLKAAGYDVVHYDSPDNRGIDVALIYRKARFTVLHSEPIHVTFEDGSRPTRDVLYVKGIMLNKDTLHVFINHWPSRLGGAQVSESKRMRAASLVRLKVDSVWSVVPNAAVVITGDFNDEPEDRSVKESLNAKHDRKNLADNTLFNFMYEKLGKEGSHKFQGHWGIIDQMIVTANMVDGRNGIKVSGGIAHIFKEDWLLVEDTRYTGHELFRTFSGPRYLGGYSDHLPIFIDLEINNQENTAIEP
jgi:endonuclease/exonuclease/phosphatase family metal-dependent hydrolase